MAQPQAYRSSSSAYAGRPERGLAATLKRIVITEKFQGPAGRIFLIAVAAIIAAGIGYGGMLFGVVSLVAIVGIPVIYTIIKYPKFGIVIMFLFANALAYVTRLNLFSPAGTLMDGLQGLLMIAIILKQKTEKNWKIFKSPVATMLLIWIGYNIIELANPVAASRLAWLYTIRTVAIIALTYFIFIYNINTIKFLRLLIKLWLVIAVIAAAYAFKQEYFGFAAFEDAYLHSDPFIEDLLFINGHWRKFSIYSDPVTYSYFMSVTSILCLCLITGTKKLWSKILYVAIAGFCLVCMLYSGTRGANVLMPVAMILFCILKYNRYVLIGGVAGAFVLAVLIMVPTSNPTLYRFQTTFRPNEDASYNVRKANQKRIQPYILEHPMGGGLGATGTWGQRFAPTSYLANFPPDSGYIRVAVELGWIGLIIFCTLMFTALKTGISNYYLIQNRELKSYCLAAVLVIFAYNIGNFPQEAIVQYPSNIVYYLSLAMVTICLRLDKELLATKQSEHLAETIATHEY